ncbi:energy-coupling factor transporter transmembrane protein EcfT [Fructilactobacillus ixorae]|uniref:Energy-coupling factor transporter transmembrane protein EcfT n=1 Tax=Fructilactobacillus ixorae TaxID=1750535 RepID=A0ABY5C4V2_9LACO|nr:energy-coupling factor transporter transmembrane component T [Fructilactobacillus ixorae]USS93150.1 energy-coupling factor transporter transmembrane protein EcfT [Fructilactobacillus ixorae]
MAQRQPSWLDRLTPGTQLVSLSLGLVAVFWNQRLPLAVLLWLASWGLVVSAHISLKTFGRRIRLFMVFIGLTALLQLVVVPQGPVLWQGGVIRITTGSLGAAGLLFTKFGTALVLLNLLSLLANPNAMTAAVEQWLAPLQKLGLPVSDLALTMSIAFRFLPTLHAEFRAVTAAQQARGLTYHTGSVRKRGQALLAVFVPVLVNSFKRAEDLATAMLLRGVQTHQSLTQYAVPQRTFRDGATCVGSIVLLFVVIGVNLK